MEPPVRLRLQRTSRRPSDFGLPAWAGLAWLALVGVFEIVKRVAGQPTATVCIIRNLTGVPCPTCGVTTAACHLLHLQPWQALKTQPFGNCRREFN